VPPGLRVPRDSRAQRDCLELQVLPDLRGLRVSLEPPELTASRGRPDLRAPQDLRARRARME